MKKIDCIQRYVIDKLIDDEKLSTGNLIDAMSKVCSKEQFDNILSILIETPVPCTNMPELEYKENLQNKTNLVRMSMFIPKGISTDTKMKIIKILIEQFNLSLNQTKKYVDNCIGKYDILPNTITQAEVDKITEKLEPYNVIVSAAGFFH